MGSTAAEPANVHVVEAVLPQSLVKELVFIHKACAVPGYRDNYLSSTLACAPVWAYPALLKARDIVRHAAEIALNKELELHSETTVTASWLTGAELPRHRDDNADYLSKREFSAVVWLNGKPDFSGGDFFYERGVSGDKVVVPPKRGSAAFFASSVWHGVEKVTGGERVAMNFWFTTEEEACEDARITRRALTPSAHSFQFGNFQFNFETCHYSRC